MLVPDARIVVRKTELPFGAFSCQYEWEGGKIALVNLDLVEMAQPISKDVFVLGRLCLRIISRVDSWYGYLVMRDGWKAQLFSFLYRASLPFRWIYVRLILTLHVWGLARYEEDCVPYWRDVHILRRIAEFFEAKA